MFIKSGPGIAHLSCRERAFRLRCLHRFRWCWGYRFLVWVGGGSESGSRCGSGSGAEVCFDSGSRRSPEETPKESKKRPRRSQKRPAVPPTFVMMTPGPAKLWFRPGARTTPWGEFRVYTCDPNKGFPIQSINTSKVPE